MSDQKLGSVSLKYNFNTFLYFNKSPFIDTGTTLIYLSYDLFDIFQIEFNTFCRL